MIKSISQLGIQGNFLNIIKGIYLKNKTNPEVTITLNSKRLKAKIRNKSWIPFQPLLFNSALEVLARASKQEKEIKEIQTRKKGVK